MMAELSRVRAALSDRYPIERRIGVGGMATVYAARDQKHDRPVAVKVLRPEIAAALGADRFVREIKIAAQLHHPHILSLHDSGLVGDLLYYVMPYVEGQSLRERLREAGPLPVDEALRILRDVVDGVAAAHERGFVHRDLKPENVMLQGRHAMVMDFGVAKALNEAAERESVTASGVAVGTPLYMAPEQALADPTIDHRVDIYALGVLGYEMLTGAPPFTDSAVQDVIAAHVHRVPEPIGKHRPDTPPALAAAVMKCLEKRPADRWRTGDELLTELELVMRTGSSGTFGQWLARIRPPRRALVTTAAVGALLAAVVFVGTRVLGREGLVDNRAFVAVFANGTGDATLDHVGRIAADLLARGLQETRLVDVVDPRAVLALAQDGPTVTPVRRAERSGARILVAGEYYRVSDSLRLEAHVTDTRSRSILAPIQPVTWLGDPMGALAELNERVTTAVATLVSPQLDSLSRVIRLPTEYSAYRDFVAATDYLNQGDFLQAAQHFGRARQTDPSFATAALYSASLYATVGFLSAADSIGQSLEQARDGLTEAERRILDWLQEWVAGNKAEAYYAIRRALDLAPGSPELIYTVGRDAIDLNRPAEGLAVLESADPTSLLFTGNPEILLEELLEAHHMLGNHREELSLARRGRSQFPGRLWPLVYEADVLAALGRPAEVSAVVEQGLALQAEANLSPGGVYRLAALELNAHGYDAPAQALLERAVTWYSTQERRFPMEFAETIYLAGQWEAARDSFRVLVSEDADDLERLGFLGVSAARVGDQALTAEVERRLASVRRPYLAGAHTLWRARIAAVQGATEQAVGLLREAFGEGLAFGKWLHRDVDLASLRDDARFTELLRPKG